MFHGRQNRPAAAVAAATAAAAVALLLGTAGCGGGEGRGQEGALEGSWRVVSLRSGADQQSCPGTLTVPSPYPTRPPYFARVPVAACGADDLEEFGPGGAYRASGVLQSYGFESMEGGTLWERAGTWRLEGSGGGGTLTRQVTRNATDRSRNGAFEPRETTVFDPPVAAVFAVRFGAAGWAQLDQTLPDGRPLSTLLRRR